MVAFLSSRLRWFLGSVPGLLVLTLVAVMLTTVAARPVKAEQPVARNGAKAVQRPLPVASQPFHGAARAADVPIEPGRAKASGKPLSAQQMAARDVSDGVRKPSAAAIAKSQRALAGPASDVSALAAATSVLLRPGYLLGDTSLIAYFNADVVEGDPASWDAWYATVTDVETGDEQRSITLDRDAIQPCRVPRTYCASFGSADGWVLTDGRQYTVTITVIRPGGILEESLPSNPARARRVDTPPSVPAAQAAGCSCPNVLTRAPGVQAMRGNLVNTATGAMVRTEQDLAMASFGIPFQAVRVYSSSNTTIGMFGPNWSWTYDARIVSQANGDARVQAEDGSQAVFTGTGNGAFTRPAGVESRLSRSATAWTLRTADQRTLTFTADGVLTKVANARGDGVTLSYTDGRLSSLTDAAGRVMQVETNTSGRITTLTLPDRRAVSFTYDTAGRLASVRDPRLAEWRYSYDTAGRLNLVRDPLQKTVVAVAYGADGRVSTQTDGLGAVTRFGYNAAQQLATTTDPDGVITLDGYRDNVLLFSRNGNGDTTIHRYNRQLNRGLTVDALGNQDEVTYDEDGNPVGTRSADPFSYTENNQFDTSNNLTRHVDRRGQPWQYTYNDQNEMTGQREPGKADGYTYTYNSRGLVETRTDPRRKVTRYEYDAAGNRTAEISPTGRRTEMGYDGTGRMTSLTDPRGTVDDASALTRAAYTTRTVYDAQDRPVQSYAPGNLFPYLRTYDLVGQLVLVTDPLKRITSYRYDDAGRLISMTDPRLHTTRYTYTPGGRNSSVTDAAGHRVSWTFNVRGQMATEIAPRGNQIRDNGGSDAQVAPYVTTLSYDALGHQTRAQRPGPDGIPAMVDTSFDELGRATGQLDELSHPTSMGYDAAGNITSMTDENGNSLGYDYDESGRRTQGVDAKLNSSASVEYDEAGNPITQTTATGGVVKWKYDDDSRPVAVIEPRGNVDGANPDDYTTTYTYDGAGNPISQRDPLGNTIRFEYDGQDRLTAMTQADGAVTRRAYDDAGQVIAVAGPVKGTLANTLSAAFIAQTQLVAGHGPVAGTILNLPGVTSPVSFAFGIITGVPVTRFAYDANGNSVATSDQLGRIRRTVYDDLDQPAFTADPLGRVRSYGYDADGNLTTLQTASNFPGVALTSGDRARRTITSSYDNLNRLTRVVEGSEGPAFTYGYDANDRLTSSADPGGLSSFAYDDTGLITRSERNGRVFGYLYDENDNVRQRTYPDGTVVDATYDDGDRMDTLRTTRAGSSQSFRFEYDPADRLTTTTYPGSSGAAETRTFDRAGRLSEISATSGAGVITGYAVARDQVGNPTQITRTTRDSAAAPRVTEVSAYAYDASQRVTSACYGAQTCDGNSAERFDYGYDLVGNRTTQQHRVSGDNPVRTLTTYAYDPADQLRLTTSIGTNGGIEAYDYDGEGNQTRSGDERFTYNLDHTLATASTGGQTTSFTYDAQGNRVSGVARLGNQTQTRTWDWDQNQAMTMLASESGSGGSRSYVYAGDGSQLGLYTGGGAGGSLYTHDWLGGTAAVLAADGSGEWAYNYDPFGNARGSAIEAGGRRLDAQAPVNPLQFAGGYNDGEGATGGGSGGQAGNYHLGARDYDTQTGRFTGADPVDPAFGSPGVSSYSYTDGRPTAAIDPAGEQSSAAGATTTTDAYPDPRREAIIQSRETRAATEPPDATTEVLPPDFLGPQRALAQKAINEAEQFTQNLGDEIVHLVLDLVGVTDAMNCIQKGDVGACLSTVLGAVPWGKIFKAAKVLVKAIGLGRRLIEGWGRVRSARVALEAIDRQIADATKAALEKKLKQEAIEKAQKEAAEKAAKARAEAEAQKRATAEAKETAERARAKADADAKDVRRPGCRTNSFAAGTAVVMADGATKPIDSVKPGDAVAAAPESGSGAPQSRQVTATLDGRAVRHLIDLQLVGAGSGGGGPPATSTLRLTAGHQLYVPGTGWVQAGALVAGQHLASKDGSAVTVSKVTPRTQVATVYNLTVADRHTYYVRTASGTTVLSHNDAGGEACRIGQVDYGSNELSRAVQDRRILKKDRGGNYAAARLEDGSILFGRSSGKGARGVHAEEDILSQAGDRKILELYTEREPCASKCLSKVQGIHTTWSFKWNPPGVRPQSSAALKASIRGLFS